MVDLRKIMFKKRNAVLVLIDSFIINCAYLLGLWLRFDGTIPEIYFNIYKTIALPLTAFHIIIFTLFMMYRNMWRYASIREYFQLMIGVFTASISSAIILIAIGIELPRSIYAIALLVILLGTTGLRALARITRSLDSVAYKKGNIRKTMIIGAGEAGLLVAKEILRMSSIPSVPVVFIDDDPQKQGKKVLDIPVFGGKDKIDQAIKRYNVEEIILAIPSASKEEKVEIANLANDTQLSVKVLPGVYEFIDGKINVHEIRDIEIADLLGREEVHLDEEVIQTFLTGRKILVTGAGGTIGSELCRQILRFQPKELILLDIYENTTYEIQNEILRKYPNAPITVCIESIRDQERIDQIFNDYEPEIVFHAAAHKHVPLMENSYNSAVKNNIFGTLNVMKASEKHGVEKFVNISTDKAVNPTSVMGCTKRVVEIMLQTIDKNSNTDFSAVRFGNVLGSHGSVIPLFRRQIKEGGPVTVTHKDIIRYFMTIPEACQLVLQAGAIANGGEILVLEMGDPVKIDDLARNLIELHGLIPEVDIEIKYTGLRQGEKLYEELLVDTENCDHTSYDKIYIEKPQDHEEEQLWEDIRNLENMTHLESKEKTIEALQKIVPEFTPDLD